MPRDRPSNFDVAPEDIPKLQNNMSRNMTLITYRSVVSEKERRKIRNAFLKNLDYVKRKDRAKRLRELGLMSTEEFNAQFGYVKKKQKIEEHHLVADNMSVHPSHMNGCYGSGLGALHHNPELYLLCTIPDTAVFVSGFPETSKWFDIDSLFRQFGRIRRTKMYRDSDGRFIGNALVVFERPEPTFASIKMMNGYELSTGEKISVSKPDIHFNPDENEKDSSEDLFPCLPEECESDKYPVIVLRNCYLKEEAEKEPNFFEELEMDIMLECCKHGNVRKIVTPDHPYYEGSVVVTFEDERSAVSCANAMDGRWFDQKQIEIEFHPAPIQTNEDSQLEEFFNSLS